MSEHGGADEEEVQQLDSGPIRAAARLLLRMGWEFWNEGRQGFVEMAFPPPPSRSIIVLHDSRYATGNDVALDLSSQGIEFGELYAAIQDYFAELNRRTDAGEDVSREMADLEALVDGLGSGASN